MLKFEFEPIPPFENFPQDLKISAIFVYQKFDSFAENPVFQKYQK